MREGEITGSEYRFKPGVVVQPDFFERASVVVDADIVNKAVEVSGIVGFSYLNGIA